MGNSNCQYVSEDGRIFSIYNGFLKQLKTGMHEDGYVKADHSINGKLIYTSMHREVAKAFIPNPKNLPQVNHKDGVKTNNHYTNLEWVTLQENNLHCCRVLGHRTGSKHTQSKFTEDQIRDIRKDNRTLQAIAKDYGCYFSTIHKIKKRESWKHVE